MQYGLKKNCVDFYFTRTNDGDRIFKEDKEYGGPGWMSFMWPGKGNSSTFADKRQKKLLAQNVKEAIPTHWKD